MKTKPTNEDLDALMMFCQASLEESEHDMEAGKIFGKLYNLAHSASERLSLRMDALDNFISGPEIEKTKADLDDGTPGEILLIATILRVMAETTEEHANDLRCDDAHLRAEDAEGRATCYRAVYAAIIKIFA